MEISILLTILLIITSLGGASLQRGMVCLINMQQLYAPLSINYTFNNPPFQRAEKLFYGVLYLLNIINTNLAYKTSQTVVIQPQNLKFEG